MSYPKDLIYAWFKQIECLADKKDPKNQKPIDADLALRMIKEHAKQDAEYIEGCIGNIEFYHTAIMATLKISDLSVGDWVRWKVYDKTYDICISQITDILVRGVHDGIEYGMKITQMSPIPITAEILEENGWWPRGHYCVWDIEDDQGTSHDGDYVITWYADDEYLTISWGGREDEVLVERTIMECRVKYIHQLQHALRLVGVDKEIIMPNK